MTLVNELKQPAAAVAKQTNVSLTLLGKIFKRVRAGRNGDALAALITAAREDHAFRKRLILVLRLPTAQREPLLHTAVEEMKLRGEPAAARQAFATLATEQGAKTALKLLESR